eukprot:CAMPEP_0170644770 /NCGR_PEP_ID=MMETSP0224-20130122/42674_1 /TAXON_ID=285029 /ORGANISM="Togula jolla, Strain CCCM 725" /LENGTH=57 /DNA_ID=CAMNT_0010975843 /DNA_START=135 /DNA_END=305 /DNA_ORIENTATION=+
MDVWRRKSTPTFKQESWEYQASFDGYEENQEASPGMMHAVQVDDSAKKRSSATRGIA